MQHASRVQDAYTGERQCGICTHTLEMIPDEHERLLSALDDLVDRYRALDEVATSAPSRTRARRDQLRAVAARHPAALRELEAVGLVAVRARAAAVVALRERLRADREAASLGEAPSWLLALLALLPRLRTVLGVKAWLAARATDGGLGSEDARRAVRSCYPDADDALLDRIASPPGGQVQQVAYEDAARALAIDVAELKRTLYGD